MKRFSTNFDQLESFVQKLESGNKQRLIPAPSEICIALWEDDGGRIPTRSGRSSLPLG
ncbi:hypothetical protein ABIE63_001271 [Limibacillus sp. MBR-115]|jgi:hypothetical protein|uniref:Uncharacterized protein n=1 Tax=Limibacillus halophilus TaxID=1579333 RepID=A0A839SSL3_9PROT|nr:hypothetical protein [Limibacillus halophilus]